jgi:hypothetical protein
MANRESTRLLEVWTALEVCTADDSLPLRRRSVRRMDATAAAFAGTRPHDLGGDGVSREGRRGGVKWLIDIPCTVLIFCAWFAPTAGCSSVRIRLV